MRQQVHWRTVAPVTPSYRNANGLGKVYDLGLGVSVGPAGSWEIDRAVLDSLGDVFRREFEADDPEAVAALLATLGLSSAEYREHLVGEGARAYAAAQEEAAADNVFGVPLFFFEREPFWGHDRLPILEQRLVEAGLSIAH